MSDFFFFLITIVFEFVWTYCFFFLTYFCDFCGEKKTMRPPSKHRRCVFLSLSAGLSPVPVYLILGFY